MKDGQLDEVMKTRGNNEKKIGVIWVVATGACFGDDGAHMPPGIYSFAWQHTFSHDLTSTVACA